MPINPIYKKLVQGPDDIFGALAYALYKERKVAYMTSKGGQLSPVELQAFQDQNAEDTQIESYKKDAAALAASFLNAGLADKLAAMEESAKRDAREVALRAEFSSMRQEIASLRTKVQEKLQEKRTFWGWVRDGLSNLLVNIVTILLIGAALIGVKAVDAILSRMESSVGLSSEQPASNPSETKSPKATQEHN